VIKQQSSQQDNFDYTDWASQQQILPSYYQDQEPTAYAAAYASEPVSAPSAASTLAGQVAPAAQGQGDVYSPYYYHNNHQDYYAYSNEDPSLAANALYYAAGEPAVLPDEENVNKNEGKMVNSAGYTDGHQPDGPYPTYYTFIPAGAGTAAVDTPAVVGE
jgi:hypothetical protein